MISHCYISAQNTVSNHEGLITAEFYRFSTFPLVTCHNTAKLYLQTHSNICVDSAKTVASELKNTVLPLTVVMFKPASELLALLPQHNQADKVAVTCSFSIKGLYSNKNENLRL